jgi:D-beta-D-heptose 7-phosphate kinase/D-beta-D-heptose 1-phosphate adenosyltransferase
MSLFQRDQPVIHIPAFTRNVFDVTGAGDTVVSVLAMALASGALLEDAARLANRAAGIVVGKVGTATVKLEELSENG